MYRVVGSRKELIGLLTIDWSSRLVSRLLKCTFLTSSTVVAIPKLLAKIGVNKDEVDFYEINEAFASQAIMSIDTVGIPYEKVNINGGGMCAIND